jgi:thiol-disulfide isomerase/thioredoxin
LNNSRRAIAATAVCAVAAFAAWGGYALRQTTRSDTSPPVRALFALNLPNPDGAPQALAQWRGKVLVVNFWATWCEPCREEIPGLDRIRKKYIGKSVEIVGIAVDSASKVREYAKTMKISYPLLVGGLESIELARSLGNNAGGLPYTVVLDSNAAVALSHLGLIREHELDQTLAKLAR